MLPIRTAQCGYRKHLTSLFYIPFNDVKKIQIKIIIGHTKSFDFNYVIDQFRIKIAYLKIRRQGV